MFFYEEDREKQRQIEVAVSTLGNQNDQIQQSVDKLFVVSECQYGLILNRLWELDALVKLLITKEPKKIVEKKKPGRKKKTEVANG